MKEQATAYYNFRTNEWDYLTQTPADWRDYISQNESAQALYSLYQEVYGDSPIEAARKVLQLCTQTQEVA
jgi:hypothetical protein